ncbi:dihydrolipoyl dehydrogenase [Bartonella sp. DGB1]|uniref:dihydrolipoyl dehydrogenase n=1 Tax=Bartonella sp. DGB1 TaxID=3239807 RepID=UPI003524FBB2
MSYDVIVIGSGPGGYVAAIKAAQLGFKVAIVEKNTTFGGTCLNVGCIPSKALLHASEMFEEAQQNFDDLGIEVKQVKVNLEKMMKHKQSVIDANTSGISFLFKKNKVDSFRATGRIISAGIVELTDTEGKKQQLETKNIIIATGSEVMPLPGVKVEFDEKNIVTSTGALSLSQIPDSLIVIGGGVIGLELGSVWARLGSQVTVVEYQDRLLAGIDKEIAKNFQRMMEKQGFSFNLGAKVTDVQKDGKKVNVTFESVKGGDAEVISADVVLVSTGRRPYTANLGLAEAGILCDERGFIQINEHWETNIAGVYAIGDVVKGPMLAHKAEDEAIAVVEKIAGQAGHVNYDVIPSVIYTYPEVATVGKSEEELKSAGIEYKVGKFSFIANGRARAMLHTDGFVKILTDAKSDKVLGGHILGYNAGEMIHELAVLMEFSGSAEDLARVCHAHPTMSEAVREAALAAFSKPIHM